MTLSRRLLLTLSGALLAMVFVGSLGLWRLNQAQQRFEYVQVKIIPNVKELEDVRSDTGCYARLNYQYLLSTDDASRAAIEQSVDALNKSVDHHIATYERNAISDDTDRRMLETDKANFTAFQAVLQSFWAKVRGGDLDGCQEHAAGQRRGA